MIEYKTVAVPATTRKVQTAIRCDLCGRTSEAAESWERGRFDRDDITIERSKGEVYPDGGSLTETRLDMCPTCWDDKFVPWLSSQGVEMRERETDW